MNIDIQDAAPERGFSADEVRDFRIGGDVGGNREQ
jgi:hypothetical protein